MQSQEKITLLHQAQILIASCLNRFRVVSCGRRFGKTTLAVEEIKGKAISQPNRIVYIAPTFQQARDLCWDTLKKELRPAAIQINEARLEIRVRTLQGGESIIFLRGWEAIETLRGQSFDFVVIDEVSSMRNFWIHYNEILRPTLTDRKGHVLFISTPKGFNHFYDLFNFQERDTDYKSFHFTTYDNPYIPVDEIDKARREIPEDQFSQEYLADFKKQEGLVYKEFDRSRHVFSDENMLKQAKTNYVNKIAGIDFGYTNPSAILTCYEDSDGNYWITDEFYKTQQTTDELVEQAKAVAARVYYPDPAEPDRIEMMRRAGLNVREVSKDIPAGINAVRELFKQNRIRIHTSCLNLISELESYRYPDSKPDKNEVEIPIKQYDHALDAMRYMLYMQAPLLNTVAKSQSFTPKHHVYTSYRVK